MSTKPTRERLAAARIELLEALIELRGRMLLEATAAGCAIIAYADGKVVPAETRRLLSLTRTDPLLSLFPHEAVLAAFEAHAGAFALDPRHGRADALRRIVPLASHPRLGRVVLEACLAVARADDLVHPREIEAARLVRDALGFAPEPGGVPARAGRRPARLRRHETAILQAAA